MFLISPAMRFFDDTFPLEKASRCHLRIQFSEHELAIALFDPVTASFPLIERYTLRKDQANARETYARILQSQGLFRQKFQQVELIVAYPQYTLVPSPLFEPANAKDFLQLSTGKIENAQAEFEKFPGQDLYVVYSWPLWIKELLSDFFENVKVQHSIFYLLNGLYATAGSGEAVGVHVQDFRQDIMYIRDGKLQYCNNFSFQTPEDFLYHILLVYDRFSISRDLVPLSLLGEIEPGSAIYTHCYNYIREIQFLNRPGSHPVPPGTDEGSELPGHFFFNLLHPA